MKYLLIILLPLLFTFSACKRDAADPDPYISAKAGTYPFYASGKFITTTKNAAGSYNSLEILGVMANGATVKLWIKNYSGALDSLALDSVNAAASYLPPIPSIEALAVHGNLVITNATPQLKGRFTFTCTDSTVVIGDFSVNVP
jgi:hypothetical protein